jgi:hypothetical protein
MDRHFDQLMQRARRYWFIDGLVEITAGMLFLLIGLYFYLQSLLPPASFLSTLLTPGLVVLVIGGGALARKIIQALKGRLTYRRTGYVSYPAPSRRRRIATAGVAMLIAGLTSSLFGLWKASLAWIPAFSGLVIGMAMLYSAHRFGLGRFYLLAAYSAVLGVGATLSGWSEGLGLAAYYGLMAPALLLCGGLTLSAYLRSTRPQEINHER